MEHLVLQWMYADSKRPAVFHEGKWWLAYGWRMYAVPGMCLSIVLAMTLLVLPTVDQKNFQPVLGIIGMFSLFGLPLYIEARRKKVAYDSDSIQGFTPWTSNTSMRWEEVTGLRFSPGLQWWVLTSERGEKIRISMFMRGIRNLISECETRNIPIDFKGWDPKA